MFCTQSSLRWLHHGASRARKQSMLYRFSPFSTRRGSTSSKSIYVFGTFDTKGDEVTYLSQSLGSKLSKWSDPAVSGTTIKVVDISTSRCITHSDTDTNPEGSFPVDMTCRDLVSDWNSVRSLDRTESAEHITKSLRSFIDSEYGADRMCGAIAVGGSGGTAMASTAFTQCLPLGFPKLIISTVASSAMTEHYIGHSDLILMPSIVDVSGINAIYKVIAENAACSMVAMAQNHAARQLEAPCTADSHGAGGQSKVFTVGVTMFGVTTQSVEFIKNKLYQKYGDNVNVLIFHATGTGGKCMEYLVEDGFIDGLIDLTTTGMSVDDLLLSCALKVT